MSARSSPSVPTDGQRAQTVIDVLVGVGVFMIAIAFVFSFIPSMVDPFSQDQEVTLVADRIAGEVADGMLVETNSSGVLNETCTYAFFESSYGDGAQCALSFDETETDLATRLGVDSRYSINVTIRRNVTNGPDPDIMCTDGSAVLPCSSGPDRLAIGPNPPADGSVISTRRTRLIDGKDVSVVVKLW